MHKYALSLLALVGVACSDQQTQTTSGPAQAAASPDSVAAAAPLVSRPAVVPLAQVPASLRQPGQLLEGWRWQDANGENLLLVFRSISKSRQQLAASPPDSDAVQDMEDFERTAWLTARQYVRQQAGQYKELWRLQDAVTNCPLDMALKLQPGSTAITDLDHDGRSETTLMYALACRGDVSEAGLKLIMRAGAAKYALRGTSVVQYDSVPAEQRRPAQPCCLEKLSAAQQREGNTAGYYQTEAEFRTAPPAFLAFARQHWQKFSIEKFGEHEEL